MAQRDSSAPRWSIIRHEGETVRTIDVPHNYSLEIEQFSKAVRGEEKPYITEAFSVRNASLIDSVLKEIDY